MKGYGRPHPRDTERMRLVRIELAKQLMTISDLSKVLKMSRPHLTEIINGTRISKKNEEKIAAFFGKRREELFPIRSLRELRQMREAELSQRSAA
jgi:plasmid maintenance system antidote protein VapI